MSDNFDIFRGLEKFDLILKKIIVNNKEIFEETKVDFDNCCVFSFHNNKNYLHKVNSNLPTSIKNIIGSEWKDFCKNNKA